MYIVAIAWMYVTILMAATQDTVFAGVATLVFYGIVPCAVVMYILMAPTRARRKKAQTALAAESVTEPISSNSPPSQSVPLLGFCDTRPVSDR
jgi:hypothetical protein